MSDTDQQILLSLVPKGMRTRWKLWDGLPQRHWLPVLAWTACYVFGMSMSHPLSGANASILRCVEVKQTVNLTTLCHLQVRPPDESTCDGSHILNDLIASLLLLLM
jgi:hypothetical protein